MSVTVYLVSVIVVALLCLSIGALLAHFRASKIIMLQKNTITQLQATHSAHLQIQAEKEKTFIQTQQGLVDTFAALSSRALAQNNEQFLSLAKENLKQFQVQAIGDLDKKEKAIESLIKPIAVALEKAEQQIHAIEKDRKESYGALNKHLESLVDTQQKLHNETRNLVQALRRPEVRGQWGELTLKRLAELAGMVEHCDFIEQSTVQTDSGRLRPDMVVKLPGGRDIVVDIKTPLDAYLNAIEATTDDARKQCLDKHARHVRERVRELASKAYWNQFDNAPDFVVLFIPGDQFLSAALDIDHDLLEDALKNKVILATPTSFVALLRAVAYGWRQEVLAANAEQIRTIGEELYDRMATFTEYLSKLGRSLDQSVETYNKTVASFETRIVPSARKFKEMGVHAKKELNPTPQVDKTARQIATETSD